VVSCRFRGFRVFSSIFNPLPIHLEAVRLITVLSGTPEAKTARRITFGLELVDYFDFEFIHALCLKWDRKTASPNACTSENVRKICTDPWTTKSKAAFGSTAGPPTATEEYVMNDIIGVNELTKSTPQSFGILNT
jgi:hypothetical protein